MNALRNLASAARLGWDLVGFLRERWTPEQCVAQVREHLARREQHFLDSLQRLVYGNPHSPYHPLLREAGCELGDVQRLVQDHGLDGALRRLQEAGVYLTYEEFKGRQETVRGNTRFRYHETDFDNPRVRAHFRARSGGTPGRSVTAPVDLRFLAFESAHRGLTYAAHGIRQALLAQWRPVPPEPWGTLRLLHDAKIEGITPVRWFSPTPLRDPLGAAGLLGLIAVGRPLGYVFPWPQHVPMEDAGRVAIWLASAARAPGFVVLSGMTSAALAVARVAEERGLGLDGVVFAVTGEPVTPARLRQLSSSGARVVQDYGASEIGRIAAGCPSPAHCDDMHLRTEALAVIQHSREYRGILVEPLLFTTLHPLAGKMLLNVETDDTAVLEQRRCGCLLEDAGLTTHIHHVRSFGKLTTQGMAVLSADLVRIAEEVLPARFGGSLADYQFVEHEGPDGTIALTLRLHPEAGEVDETQVVETVLAELRKGRPSYRLAAELWRQARALRVARGRPLGNSRGKVLPLFLASSLGEQCP